MNNAAMKVPLIQQDLSSEETIVEIAESLRKLEAVFESVITSVEERLELGKTRLQTVHKRCQRAKDKVERLKGINKSIVVHSSSKYPVPKPNLFFENIKLSSQTNENDSTINLNRLNPANPNKISLKEKMKFYHVKDVTQLLRKNEEITPFEGLGGIPENLKSVCSLLLYNTDANIYVNYRIIDPFGVSKTSTKQLQAEGSIRSDLEPAPASLVSNDPLRYKNFPNYLYMPISQDVPDIQVPLDLPHLPGIAGDLRYNEEIPADVDDGPMGLIVEPNEDTVTLIQELPKVEDTIMRDGPPPPPPPPPPQAPPPIAPKVLEESVTEKEQKIQLTQAPPPPPPPASSLTDRVPPPEPDSRANLMAAIRAAGGKVHLKPATSRSDSSVSAKPGLGLMDDLHDKLLRRRKGIIGKSESPEVSMFQEIATKIPLPPDRNDSTSEGEDNSSWEE